MTARGTIAALVLPLALLSACGDDSDSAATDPGGSDSSTATDTPSQTEQTTEPTESPSAAPPWPACDEVWVADARLPLRYQGCLEGDEAVKADNLGCSSGQRIVRYDNTFYSVAGGTIHQASGPLENDKEYLKSVRVCRA